MSSNNIKLMDKASPMTIPPQASRLSWMWNSSSLPVTTRRKSLANQRDVSIGESRLVGHQLRSSGCMVWVGRPNKSGRQGGGNGWGHSQDHLSWRYWTALEGSDVKVCYGQVEDGEGYHYMRRSIWCCWEDEPNSYPFLALLLVFCFCIARDGCIILHIRKRDPSHGIY